MFLDEIAAYLQAEGLGTVGTTLFKGGVPLDAPMVTVQDALIALTEGPGLPAIRPHSPRSDTIQQPTLQVIVRGGPFGYAAARLTAEAVYKALDGLANVTLSGTFYLWLLALQPPWPLRTDDLNRPHLVFNVRCARAGS